jgi:hypothetical protein
MIFRKMTRPRLPAAEPPVMDPVGIPPGAMRLEMEGGWGDICLFVRDFQILEDTLIYADVNLTGAGALPLRFSFRHAASGEEYDYWSEYPVGRTTLLLRGYELTARSPMTVRCFNEIRFGGQGTGRVRLALAIVRDGVLEFGAA